jgi:hypothetical protein
MQVINEVLKTKDYDKFCRLEGNRMINTANLKQIKKSMLEKQLISPIIVNEKMEVIDGQHRFQAQKELELPVYYVVQFGYGREETQILNSNSRNWSIDDYMDSYCESNLTHYLTYRDFFHKWGFKHNEIMNMLNGTIHDRSLQTYFKCGKYKVKKLKQAEQQAKQITEMIKFYAGYKRRGFVLAMLECFNNDSFDFKYFLKKCKYQSTKLVDCVRYQDYLKIIEEIYNYKTRTKEKIRLY